MRLKLGAFCCNMQITIANGDYKSGKTRTKKRNDRRKQNKSTVANGVLQI